MERERVRPARPPLDEIRRYLAGEPYQRWNDLVRRFATAETLEPKDRKAYLRTMLYPARFCYSWLTGRIGSNDEAVAYLAETAPAGVDVDLVARAPRCRRSDAGSRPSVFRTSEAAVPDRCLCGNCRALGSGKLNRSSRSGPLTSSPPPAGSA
jgi:hypothetical protein